jgi:hypothetical protein
MNKLKNWSDKVPDLLRQEIDLMVSRMTESEKNGLSRFYKIECSELSSIAADRNPAVATILLKSIHDLCVRTIESRISTKE